MKAQGPEYSTVILFPLEEIPWVPEDDVITIDVICTIQCEPFFMKLKRHQCQSCVFILINGLGDLAIAIQACKTKYRLSATRTMLNN